MRASSPIEASLPLRGKKLLKFREAQKSREIQMLPGSQPSISPTKLLSFFSLKHPILKHTHILTLDTVDLAKIKDLI